MTESNPGNKLHKHPIFWEIFKLIFPGTSVEPNHIKAKLRWVQETYYKEKKKLSLTGAGMLLEDMDASNPSYASHLALLNFASNDEAGMPPYSSAEIPMGLSGSELYDHGAHGHGLPPILDLMDSTNPPAAVASTSGASIAGAGDDDIFTTPFPSQAQLSFSVAGGLDVFESSSSPSSALLSPSTKHKRGALDHKCNTLAEAFYCSSIDTLQICLQLEQEHTRSMVHYSNKQVLLNNIVHTLELSIPAKIEQNANRVQHSCSTDIGDFNDNQTQAFQWNYSNSDRMSLNRVQEILSVALYRLGHSGNGGGERDAALQCGCSVGNIVAYTNCTVAGLLKLNNKVMQFASEEERQHAVAWVRNTTGVEQWGKGWLVVNGTHVPLAWKPGVHSQEHFCYKGFHSINVVLVILPHLLWIVKLVVGRPGSVQDSKVWASGSNILKKPRLYLDKGEFIWVDGRYGHSAITVGPFSHIAANKS
ncbi:hypothetical protein NDA13_001294 [Ustilago tritici]|nr:hypothetical protein NDA13_001294 [Ustilago tritici]